MWLPRPSTCRGATPESGTYLPGASTLLGYGSIDQGWAPGDADLVTTSGLFPTDLNLGDVVSALGSGLQQGVTNFLADLINPGTYQIIPWCKTRR